MMRTAVACIGVLVASVTVGCVAAVPGDPCPPGGAVAGTDGTHVLQCPAPDSQLAVWGVVNFNEEPVTHARFRSLMALAAGPMTDVKRVAVIGDNAMHGIIGVDPHETNPRPYALKVTVTWKGGESTGRPCNRVTPPEVEVRLDADGTVSATVRWSERVGQGRYAFCGEPRIGHVSVTDANGHPVATYLLIA